MLLEGPDDASLAGLYSASDPTLMGHGEGAGLPILEAGHYGCELLLRELPVFVRSLVSLRVTSSAIRLKCWGALGLGSMKPVANSMRCRQDIGLPGPRVRRRWPQFALKWDNLEKCPPSTPEAI